MVILGYELNLKYLDFKFNTVRKIFYIHLVREKKVLKNFSLKMCSDEDVTRKFEDLRKICINSIAVKKVTMLIKKDTVNV